MSPRDTKDTAHRWWRVHCGKSSMAPGAKEWKGPLPGRQSRGKCLEVHRKEEHGIKSRGKRGLSEDDSLEVSLHRGGQLSSQLRDTGEGGQTEGGIPDSKPKASLTPTRPCQPKFDSLAPGHCPPSVHRWHSWLNTLREELRAPSLAWEAPMPQLTCRGWGGVAGLDLRRWGEAVGEGVGRWQLPQQAAEQAGWGREQREGQGGR